MSTLEERLAIVEARQVAHDRLLRTQAEELERQAAYVKRIMHATEDDLRTSHHELEAGVEIKLARVEAKVADQLRLHAEERVEATWARKENRILGFGLACLLFVGFILQRVQVDVAGVAGLVGALLGALALFWRQLDRGAAKAKRDSIAPPPR